MKFEPAIVSAITALVAIIVSPIVSIYVARRQIRASVISTSRQKWIDQLREQLSELISSLRFLSLGLKTTEVSQKEWIERFQRTFLMEQKINLLLNPNESDHAKLSRTIRSSIETLFKKKEDEKKNTLVSLTDDVLKQSQVILKREWERVKLGD